jgi:hypothetical protein
MAIQLETRSPLQPGKYWIEANDSKSITQLDLWLRGLPAGAITMLDFVAGQKYEFALFVLNQPVERWSLYGDGSGLGYPAIAPEKAQSRHDIDAPGMPGVTNWQDTFKKGLESALSEVGTVALVVIVAAMMMKNRS